MSSSTSDFPEDSIWPRRLLHVPSLTSHPWRPGNKYGTAIEPAYNALSYTWGRYALDSTGQAQHPGVGPLHVRGITWENHMPRIDPAVFTTADLAGALDAARGTMKYFDGNMNKEEKFDFIWLDVACIDQTPGSPDMAAEIGRQAQIFRGAETVWVWLHGHPSIDAGAQLGEKMIRLGLLEGESCRPRKSVKRLARSPAGSPNALNDNVLHWARAVSHALKAFLSDPWFSSLWTLQESFLRPNAALLLRDARTADFPDLSGFRGGSALRPMTLWLLSNTLKWVRDAMLGADGRFPRHLALYSDVHHLWNVVDGSGLGTNPLNHMTLTTVSTRSADMDNPFPLLRGARGRTTSREEDRVYGIMQVFDLKLGRAAPGHAHECFSLDELKQQLAVALVEKYPFESQLLVRGAQCPPGWAWAVDESVEGTQDVNIAWTFRQLREGSIPLACTMRPGRIPENGAGSSVRSGICFSGRVTPVASWVRRIVDTGVQRGDATRRVYLDGFWERKWREDQDMDENVTISVDQGHDERIYRWIGVLDGAVMLLLAVPPPPDLRLQFQKPRAFALLLAAAELKLQSGKTKAYTRLGFCVWDPTAIAAADAGLREYAEGVGADWEMVDDGFFC